MRVPTLIAADGASWEAELVLAFDGDDHGVTVVRRCVDIVELLSVAATGLARVALVAAELRHLDVDAVDRLRAADVIVVGVVARGDDEAETRLHALGVEYLVPSDSDPRVVASVINDAVSADLDRGQPGGPSGLSSLSGPAGPSGVVRAGLRRTYSEPGASTTSIVRAPIEEAEASARPGSVVAVWGPTGAPGRTTVAVGVADELARLGCSTLLVDADVYGGAVGQVLGLLDESAGIAAACRQAGTTRLDSRALAELCWQLNPALRVLTGIPRAQRWPELRASSLTSVLTAAKWLADFTVVDCGFCLESDEELSFDTMAPRRNGATLAVLDLADLVLIVGGADPVSMQRLVRGLTELRDAEVNATSWIVVNRVPRALATADPNGEVAAALMRFAGRVPAALLPRDQDAADAAMATGKTLAEARPSSPLRRAMVELAAAIAGVEVPVPRRHRRRR